MCASSSMEEYLRRHRCQLRSGRMAPLQPPASFEECFSCLDLPGQSVSPPDSLAELRTTPVPPVPARAGTRRCRQFVSAVMGIAGMPLSGLPLRITSPMSSPFWSCATSGDRTRSGARPPVASDAVAEPAGLHKLFSPALDLLGMRVRLRMCRGSAQCNHAKNQDAGYEGTWNFSLAPGSGSMMHGHLARRAGSGCVLAKHEFAIVATFENPHNAAPHRGSGKESRHSMLLFAVRCRNNALRFNTLLAMPCG